jgi:hypothetical protein
MKSKVSHVFLFVFVVLVNASLLAQGLNWSAPQSSTNTASPPGGLAGRPAISGVSFNNAIWAAETVNDSSQAIMMLSNNGSERLSITKASLFCQAGAMRCLLSVPR